MTEAVKSGSVADASVSGGTGSGYRVLARKYRPATFDDLIGQQAMVRTVSNAFESGRVPQAWILTGVRGVGKTTTARILARALNYELPDGSIKGPTISMPGMGVHCQAIMESRHIDVLEMDAASHTGVEDVRQITDGVRYAPSSARYKVYIIDEVHMLSEKAFNAFLKTLEEPPPHAKFIFATTEIRKVPVTVLSRCQRFDLRRVETDVLTQHLTSIVAKEGVEAEQDALGLIARAAEGSVRDSLSLLDQAIAHAAGHLKADEIRRMLGLADRTRIIDLFEHLARGDIAAAFTEFREQYDTGADPVVVLSDLAEFVNFVTRVKAVPSTADNIALSEAERTRGREFAAKLSMRVLARMWQMLLKGISEVQAATRPAAAAEMVLVRIAYAADLPTPDEVIRTLDGGGAVSASPAPRASSSALSSASPSSSSQSSPAPRSFAPQGSGGDLAPRMAAAAPAQALATAQPHLRLNSLPQIVALAVEKRDVQMKMALESDVRLIRIEDGRLELALESHAARTLPHEIGRKLEQWTGRRWAVVVSNEAGQPTLRQQNAAQKEELTRGVVSDPRVQAVLARFPGTSVEVRRIAPVDMPEELPIESDNDDDA